MLLDLVFNIFIKISYAEHSNGEFTRFLRIYSFRILSIASTLFS